MFVYKEGGNEQFIGVDTVSIYMKWGNQFLSELS